METAIGVFASRGEAEKAVKELWEKDVPKESIVFLTTSENEAKSVAKEFGAYVGGFVGGAAGMTTGVVAASLLLPGVGTVFALGFGAAALLGLAGAGAGATAASHATHDEEAPKSATDEPRSEDVAFFREVLKRGAFTDRRSDRITATSDLRVRGFGPAGTRDGKPDTRQNANDHTPNR